MSNILKTKYGTINGDKITALVTTESDGAILIVGDNTYKVKPAGYGEDVEPIISKSERVFNVFKDWFDRIIDTVEQTLWKKKYNAKLRDWYKDYNLRIKAEAELKSLKQQIEVEKEGICD